jgi:hypothetical protein
MRPLILALALTLPVAGCLDTLDGAREYTGVISLTARADGGGGIGATPLGAFYHFDGLISTPVTTDSCVAAPYSPLNSFIPLPTVDAGQRLFTTMGTRQDTLWSFQASGMQLYQLSGLTRFIPYTPGDTFRVEVPGAVFPASDLRVRTAEAFTITPPPNPDFGDSIQVTWSAAPAPGSRMTFQLIYATDAVLTAPNAQIFCNVADDGEAWVPLLLSEVWRVASNEPALKQFKANRFRSTTFTHDAVTRVVLTSNYPYPLDTIPPP